MKFVLIFGGIVAIDLENCTSFYDGCNSCSVENGEATLCSMSPCQSNQSNVEPYCTGWVVPSE